MRFSQLDIAAIECELPPVCVTSDELESRLEPLYTRLKLPKGRLEALTGIKERRVWNPGTTPSMAATLAAKKILSQGIIDSQQIGALIMCSVCRDFLEPASSTLVHHSLGLKPECYVFDLSNACLGILSGIITAGNMIESGFIQSALLVSGETSNALMESTIYELNNNLNLNRKTIKPAIASLTIGSGACAILLTKHSFFPGHAVLGEATRVHSAYHHLCRGNADKGMSDAATTLMETDSEALLIHGIETAKSTWDDFKKQLEWSENSLDVVCTHQVGSAHKKQLLQALNIMPQKDYSTLEYLGNSGSAAAPTTFALAVKNNVIQKGDKVALLGIGSGIHCSMIGIQW